MRSTAEQLALAAAALQRGELVGMPTETVYGLAGDARNPAAITRIFALKGRPANHPVIVHLAHVDQLSDWARDVPESARLLAAVYWPGPLTMILQRAPGVLDAVTGGQDSVGIRIPNHPLALALLQRFGGALVAPSANRFGHVSPTSAAHVRAEFSAEELPLVLDGGSCDLGIESTIVDLRGAEVRVLRPGSISAAQLAETLGCAVAQGPQHDAPRVSGALASHYAPRTPAEMYEAADLAARYRVLEAAGVHCVVIACEQLPEGAPGILLGSAAEPYAQAIYAALRRCDQMAAMRILIEAPPQGSEWHAVRDRLQRAVSSTQSPQ